MNLKTLAMKAAIALTSASTAVAATFTVGGTDYDVTTVVGTLEDNSALLESQVWFGNPTLSGEFASTVRGALGFPNPRTGLLAQALEFSPYFVVQSTSIPGFGSFFGATAWEVGGQLPQVFSSGLVTTQTFTFAVATEISPVPLPAGALLLLSGLGGIAAVKRRKKRFSTACTS